MKKIIMTKLFTLAALALMGVTMSSCSDDDEEANVDPVADRMTLLTNNASKVWFFSAQLEAGEDITIDCQLDDVWTFKSEGLLEVALNEVCYEGQDDGENQMGWKFNDDATFLMNPNGEEGYEIIELTSTKLVLEYEYGDEERIFKSQMAFTAK